MAQKIIIKAAKAEDCVLMALLQQANMPYSFEISTTSLIDIDGVLLLPRGGHTNARSSRSRGTLELFGELCCSKSHHPQTPSQAPPCVGGTRRTGRGSGRGFGRLRAPLFLGDFPEFLVEAFFYGGADEVA